MRKVFVLGLDSAPPKTLYERYGVDIPALGSLIDDSRRWLMRTCHPPITIPAWLVMFTGRTPGELGIYGFRHRKPGDVGHTYIINSNFIKHQTLWDAVGRAGGRVGIFGVPPTYPPRPVRGFMITDFMTPGPENQYAFPPWLKRELESRFGPLIFDVKFRRHDKERVRDELFQMTKQHLKIIEYLVKRKAWDLFIYVEIGIDRIHHAFWKYFDVSHPRYEENEELSRVIPDYYKLIDEGFERIRKALPKDTIIVVASDHGVKSMAGAFAVNEWLIKEGYLKLKEKPKKPGTDLTREIIDWDSTIAWGWGGYYSRIFINLKGREPKGIVGKEEFEDVVTQLSNDLRRVRGDNGALWRNIVLRPEEIYPEVRGDPPDIMAYFDDLNWRAAGTIGWDTPFLPENDRGPDDAVHDWHGVFTVYDPEGTVSRGMVGEMPIEHIADYLRELILSKS